MSSFGDTLKRERETRQVSLREISNATKINMRYLEALEDNRFDVLPGGVFNRGFVRAYAMHLGIDGDTMVGLYMREIATRQSLPPPPAVVAGSPSLAPPAAAVPPGAAAPPPAPAPAPDGAIAPAAGNAAGAAAGTGPAPGARPAPARRRGPKSPTISSIDDAPPPSRLSRVLVATLWLVAGVSIVSFGVSQFSARRSAGTGESPGAASEPADAAEGPAIDAPNPIPDEAPADDNAMALDLSAAGSSAEPADPVANLAGVGLAAPPPSSPARTRAPAARPAIDPARPARAASTGPAAAPPTSAARAGDSHPPAAPGPDPSQAPPAAAPPESGGEDEAGPMALRVETTRRTWLWVQCDQREVVDRLVAPGETLAFECLSVIRVSAPQDAGAVRLRINDTACLSLGEDGTRVYGYTIRVDDFERICPPGRRSTGPRR